MGSHIERYKQLIGSARGQSTVEYAVVLGALLCVVAGLGALASAVGDGVLAQHAIAAASHHVEGSVGGAIDAFCY